MPVSRRNFLGSAGALAALELATAPRPGAAAEAASPSIKVGRAKAFKVGVPVQFSYPDAAPALAIKLSGPVPGGVGPAHDIVAYSQLCVHKGCPVNFNAQREVFMCPCHFTTYDAELSGQVIIGHATTNLPRIRLTYDAASDVVTAVGVDGLIYGRVNNKRMA